MVVALKELLDKFFFRHGTKGSIADNKKAPRAARLEGLCFWDSGRLRYRHTPLAPSRRRDNTGPSNKGRSGERGAWRYN
jgi:hypothetical protein